MEGGGGRGVKRRWEWDTWECNICALRWMLGAMLLGVRRVDGVSSAQGRTRRPFFLVNASKVLKLS